MERGAVELCARKVASSTGDARKALELCRTAIESVQREAERQLSVVRALGNIKGLCLSVCGMLNGKSITLDTPPTSPMHDNVSKISSGLNLSFRVTISVMSKIIAESMTSWASAAKTQSGLLAVSSDVDASQAQQDSCPLHHRVLISSLARLTKQSSAAHFSMNQVYVILQLNCSNKLVLNPIATFVID